MPKATSGCARGGGRFGVVAHAVRLQVPHMQVEHAQARLAWARTRALQRAVRGLDGAFRQGREPARHVRHASVMEAGLQRWGASLSQSPTLALQRPWCPPCKSTSSQRPSLPAWTSCRAARRAAAHFCCVEPPNRGQQVGAPGGRAPVRAAVLETPPHLRRVAPQHQAAAEQLDGRRTRRVQVLDERDRIPLPVPVIRRASCGHARGRSLLRSICF